MGYLLQETVLSIKLQTIYNCPMKKTFKFGFLALAISLSVAACSSNKSGNEGSDTTMTDSGMAVTDTNKVDTVVKDSTVKDTSVKVKTTTTTTKPM